MKALITETFVQGRMYRGGTTVELTKEKIEALQASGQIKRVKLLGVVPVKRIEAPEPKEPAKEKPAKKKAPEKPEA